MTRAKALKALRGIVSLGIALALVGWVVVSSGIEPVKVLATVDHRLFFAAFLCHGAGFVLASWRWYLLLHHIRVHLPFLTVLRLALIGIFFNLLVPGGVGGDLIKMVYLRKESGDRYPQALLTVLLDRLLGLAGLLFIALVSVGLNLEMIATGPVELQGLLMVVGIASVAGLLGGVGFFLWPWISKWGTRWGGGAYARLPEGVRAILVKVTDALDLLRASPMKLFGLLLLAAAGHLLAAIGMYLVARGASFGSFSLPFAPCLLATQLANLVAAVPLTPGGLGGRDLVMSLLLRAAGAPQQLAGAVPVLVTLLLVTWSLIGGLALLWERGSGATAGLSDEASN